MLDKKPNGSEDINPIPRDLRFSPALRPSVAPATPTPIAAAPAVPAKKSAFEGMKCEGAVFIGEGAKVAGDISNSSTVEIQGFLEGNVVTNSLVVREGGGFKGAVQTQHAEVYGAVDGTIVVQDLLDIRATGRVNAEATYGRLAVSAGGSLAGNVQVKPPLILDETGVETAVAHDQGQHEGNSRTWNS